ncbi:MAG: hypothetical protein K2Q22_17745, partial [Cytophagales bacterium]|nr:hypothetical protein [Cytophagales bacterium]
LTVSIKGPDGSVVKIKGADNIERDNFTQTIQPSSSPTICEKYEIPNITFSAMFADIGDYTVTKELKLAAGNITELTESLSGMQGFPRFEDFLSSELLQVDESKCDFTCEQKCMTSILNDPANRAWKDNPEQYADAIQVAYQQRIGTFCTSIVQGALDKSAEAECNSLLFQMKKQVTPDPSGETSKNGYLYNNTNWLNYVLAQPQNMDWGLGGSSGSYILPTLSRLQNVKSFANGTTFGSNISWGDVLVTYHPEYCHYQACVATKESKKYDRNMALIKNWEEAIAAGYIDPLDMNDPSKGIPIVASPNDNIDPLFKTGGYGVNYKSNAISAVNNYYTEGTVDYEGITIEVDFNNNGVYNETFSIWQFASSPYTYQDEITGNPRNPTSEEKWKLFKSLYQGIKLKLENQIKSDNHCADKTQSPGTFLDPTQLIVSDFPPLPQTKAEADAINNKKLNSNFANQCSGNVSQWIARLKDATGTSVDGTTHAPIHCLNTPADITSATNILQSYCLQNCHAGNPLGYIFSEDLTPTIKAGLAPLQTILSNNGCTLLDKTIFGLNVSKNIYHCSGENIQQPAGIVPTENSNFTVDVSTTTLLGITNSICQYLSNDEYQLTKYNGKSGGTYSRLWYNDKWNLNDPFILTFQAVSEFAHTYSTELWTYFTLHNDPDLLHTQFKGYNDDCLNNNMLCNVAIY